MTEHDFNHLADLRTAFSDAIVEEVDAALASESERPREYIGASAIGDECARRIQLEVWPSFHPQAPPIRQEPISGKLRRIFTRGHRLEVNAADWLRAAGFDLVTVKPDGYPFGFITGQGQIRGHVDGIIREPPTEILWLIFNYHAGAMENAESHQSFPLIWENKVVNSKGWRGVQKHGVLKHYPKYDAQAQLYMAYMDMQATLFSFVNADTCELWFELIPFDHARAQAASDRAVHILQATRTGDLLPKAAANGEAYPCSLCRFKGECWGE